MNLVQQRLSTLSSRKTSRRSQGSGPNDDLDEVMRNLAAMSPMKPKIGDGRGEPNELKSQVDASYTEDLADGPGPETALLEDETLEHSAPKLRTHPPRAQTQMQGSTDGGVSATFRKMFPRRSLGQRGGSLNSSRLPGNAAASVTPRRDESARLRQAMEQDLDFYDKLKGRVGRQLRDHLATRQGQCVMQQLHMKTFQGFNDTMPQLNTKIRLDRLEKFQGLLDKA